MKKTKIYIVRTCQGEENTPGVEEGSSERSLLPLQDLMGVLLLTSGDLPDGLLCGAPGGLLDDLLCSTPGGLLLGHPLGFLDRVVKLIS